MLAHNPWNPSTQFNGHFRSPVHVGTTSSTKCLAFWFILILYLREDNWATLRLKQHFILHHLHNFCGKPLHCHLERLIICSEADAWNILQPNRKTPKIPLCTNIRPNTKMHIQPCFLDQLYKPNQIISSLKVVMARGRFMNVPKHIGVNGI